jgi:UDP-3-O-[3-hydroxymyristoyl] glucosamine N-acyltransferase
MKRLPSHPALFATLAVVFASLGCLPLDASAARVGGGHARTSVHRGGSVNVNRGAHVNRGANIHRDTNLNRNVNVNRNANVNVNRHIDVDVDRRWNHPVGTAVAIGATAAVIGSIIYSLPPSCSTVQVGGVTYQQCGSTWYQPRYAGSSVQYVVVNSPY